MRRTLLVAATLHVLVAGAASAQTWYSDHHTRVGFASALDMQGDELFGGRPGEIAFFPVPPGHPGAVHVFARAGDAWEERASVTGTSVAIGDGFGLALDVSGNLLVVGAPKQAGGRGGAYVFERAGAGQPWREAAHLDASALDSTAGFGTAVAIDGDAVLVGAPGEGQGTGAVLVFRRGAGEWALAETLRASSGAAGDGFGFALAADSRRVLIGAPGPMPGGNMFAGAAPRGGAAYVFMRDGQGYREQARLAAAGEEPMAAGAAVALLEDEALIGAPIAAQGAGAVLRFRWDGSTWSESGRLMSEPSMPGSLFGIALRAGPVDLLVGAPGAQGQGLVFAFRRAGDAWAQSQQLDLGMPFAFFGSALALAGEHAAVGAPGADFFEGSAYAYDRAADGTWVRTDTVFTASEAPARVTGEMRRCAEGEAAGFECADVDLVSFLPIADIGGARGTIVNDLWGWTDPETGREYALVGRSNGTSFVDVTDAGNPRYLGDLPLHEGATPNVWRDMKVYANHAFIVADGAGPHGVQVFDLTRLRNVQDAPATFTEDAHYDRIASAHNIVMNESTGFAYVVGASMGGETCGGGLHMIDVREPRRPQFAGCFADPATGNAGTGYSHDAQCVVYAGPDSTHVGREICFGSNETMLSIADVTNKDSTVAIARAAYPNAAYVHQGWISEDHRYFFMDDEGDELAGLVPRTRTIVWDITDLDDPVLLTEYLGETSASDHNLYIRGNHVYESNYVSGLRILDISDPAAPREVGYFDTVPQGENAPGFLGSWSNYPFFRSGNIIVSSMREGLFVLRFRRMGQPVS